jgi:hypothetical protein
MNKEEIKKLNDKELLELEHDTEVDCINDLSGNLKIFELHRNLLEEIENRKLDKLSRLNGFY